MWRITLIILILGFALSVAATGDTVHLRRYEPVTPYQGFGELHWGDTTYPYMDVADTWLDARHPDDNYGASQILRLNPSQDDVILLQFAQLNRAIVRGSQITDVKLVLHPVPGRFTKDVDIRIYRMNREWRDGGADGKPMYWTATYNQAMSSEKGNAVVWSKPGGRGTPDRAEQPSIVTNTSAGYSTATNTWTITSPELVNDVQYWLDKSYRNYGWAIEMSDPKSARGPVELYSSETMDRNLHPELVITFEPLKSEGDHKGIDLNVTFIERTPRYLRYNDDGVNSYERKTFRGDMPGIMKYPENGDTKKWPDKGEMLTYTAHIKNSGFDTYTGPLDWRWIYNGEVIDEGTTNINLAPEKETSNTIKLPWKGDMSDIRDEKLVFEIDPADKIKEITKNNNAQSKYVKARNMKYWVERSAYEYGKQFLTAYGSYSFEDYLKWHEHIWNETFLDKSRYSELAPDGSVQRISLDDFEIVPDGELGGAIHRHKDAPDFHFDGEWGTEWPKGRDAQKPEVITEMQRFLRAQRILLEGSLLHECSHQVLGAFDIYWSNVEPSDPDKANGKCQVKDGGDYYITRGSMYAYSGLMGGDDTRENDQYTYGNDLYALHTVVGYNSNTPYRNGFYGEWQYDMPRQVFVRLLAADGEPVKNAKVKIWQFAGMQILDKNVVAEGLIADENGILKLPDQDSGEATDVTTTTGHTLLKKNPFGRLDVVGGNSVLLLKVEGFGQKDYRFVRVVDINRHYWQGSHDKAIHDVATQISPAIVDWDTNIAYNRPVQSVLNPAEAGKLTDGDPKTTWQSGAAPAGVFLQIDLGDNAPRVAAIRLYQSEWHGHFFQRFKIEVSDDASFRSGVTELNRQFPFSWSLAMTNDKDVDPTDPSVKWITYGARPTKGRYLRITCLDNTGSCALSEIKVFAAKQ